jgi:hypothetical protein
MGPGESAAFPTDVKGVVTLLGKSTSRRKESCIECLKTREIAYISLVTRTLLVLQIAPRDLPNRVTTSITPVGNAADSRGLAKCCDFVYGNAMSARAQTPFGRSTPPVAEDGPPPAAAEQVDVRAHLREWIAR